ncbi:MAG: hypothetical protein IKK75_13245 [Clostridia bacterium]|nr:hypothetical protein [Clostridia bacterium]
MNPILAKARTFMYRNARPLDLARFQYHFDNGSKEAVMQVLSFYQNEDGGFGHAIEADNWNPNSIPLHANGANSILDEIGFDDPDHPMVQKLVNWYASGACFNGKSWDIVVPSNNDYPHAPWWHTDSVSTCHTDYNGTAQIAGFLIRYAPRGSKGWQLGVRVANEAVASLDPDTLMDSHTCACYLRMADLIEKASAQDAIPFADLKDKLHQSVHRLIVTDKSKWGQYVCKPSQFFRTRESEYYAENADIAEYECAFIARTQLSDGSWDIPWRWQDYPDEWAISKNWWKGEVILQNLLYLKGFGKI